MVLIAGAAYFNLIECTVAALGVVLAGRNVASNIVIDFFHIKSSVIILAFGSENIRGY